jgi:hypothetical protein
MTKLIVAFRNFANAPKNENMRISLLMRSNEFTEIGKADLMARPSLQVL